MTVQWAWEPPGVLVGAHRTWSAHVVRRSDGPWVSKTEVAADDGSGERYTLYGLHHSAAEARERLSDMILISDGCAREEDGTLHASFIRYLHWRIEMSPEMPSRGDER